MRLHPHIWKYYSSEHRICIICGEPQTYTRGSFIDFWCADNLDTWLKGYPEQAKKESDEQANRAKSDQNMREWEEGEKRKGKAFLRGERKE